MGRELAGRREERPRVSFGLPVYNGAETIRGCLDSILGQEAADLEIVVCDNASDDDTRAIAEQYAARDPRVRVFANQRNVGLIENVNRVFELACGEIFRWIGVHDWLEPDYTAKCLEALDADPGAIAVTTWFRIHAEDGRSICEEFTGERVDSPDPTRRFARMLELFHAGDALYDPLYSLIRRSALERTQGIRMMACADWMLAAELSLLGRFAHVPACLSHRRKSYAALAERSRNQDLMRRYHPERHAELPASAWRLFRVLLSIVADSELPAGARMRCRASAARFCLREAGRRGVRRARRFRRERLGLTRRGLAGLLPGGRGDD